MAVTSTWRCQNAARRARARARRGAPDRRLAGRAATATGRRGASEPRLGSASATAAPAAVNMSTPSSKNLWSIRANIGRYDRAAAPKARAAPAGRSPAVPRQHEHRLVPSAGPDDRVDGVPDEVHALGDVSRTVLVVGAVVPEDPPGREPAPPSRRSGTDWLRRRSLSSSAARRSRPDSRRRRHRRATRRPTHMEERLSSEQRSCSPRSLPWVGVDGRFARVGRRRAKFSTSVSLICGDWHPRSLVPSLASA